MTNKEIIKKLKAYFLKSEPEVVAQLLAAMMIDMHRLNNLDHLTEAERSSLIIRMKLNDRELNKFVENGPTGSLKSENVSFD